MSRKSRISQSREISATAAPRSGARRVSMRHVLGTADALDEVPDRHLQRCHGRCPPRCQCDVADVAGDVLATWLAYVPPT